MDAGEPLVSLREVATRVAGVTILRSIDFDLESGEAVGVYGPNGAGKTTLLRIMATLLPPSSGRGTVLGVDLQDSARFDIRRSIGFIGHVPALYPELSLRDNLRFAARILGRDDASVDGALDAVGLAGAADRLASASSHGMQRRAEFARELMRSPQLLLLDEPHSALDPMAVELVGHMVVSVTNGGGGVVIVSHDRDRVDPLVGRSVALHDGHAA